MGFSLGGLGVLGPRGLRVLGCGVGPKPECRDIVRPCFLHAVEVVNTVYLKPLQCTNLCHEDAVLPTAALQSFMAHDVASLQP